MMRPGGSCSRARRLGPSGSCTRTHRREPRGRASLCVWLAALLLVAIPPTAEVGVTVLSGETLGEQFGYSLAAGDLAGSGLDMIIVGAPGRASDDGGPGAGGVYVFSPADIAVDRGLTAKSKLATVAIAGTTAGSRFGATVAAGDWDGDGSDELVVGAPDDGLPGAMLQGALYLFDIPDSARGLRLSPADARLIIRGTQDAGRLGSSLLVADLNRDGRDELIVSAFRSPGPRGQDSGQIYVLDGALLMEATGEIPVDLVARIRITGEDAGDGIRGLAVADTDGDGEGELLVGAYLGDGPGRNRFDVGKVYVVEVGEIFASFESSAPDSAGSAESVDHGAVAPGTTEITLPDHTVAIITGAAERGFLGRTIAAGDVDLDGNDDVLVAAYGARGKGDKETAAGEVYLFFGGDDGLTGALDLADSGTDGSSVDVRPRFVARSRWSLFGLPLLMADMNGDGPQDLIAAAQFAGHGSDRGRCGEVYVYFGSLESVMAAKAGSTEHADVTIIGAHALDSIGGALLAVDLTGSGRLALVIGAPDATVQRIVEDVGGDSVRPGDAGDVLTERIERGGKVFVVTSGLLLDR